MINTFDWIEIRTGDIHATTKFYTALFGWRIIQETKADRTDVWIFDTGAEPRLENLRRGGIWFRPEGESLGIVVYIRVEDIDTTLERVTALGGKVIRTKIPVGSGYAGYFKDPSGNLLALYQDGDETV